MTFRKSVIKVRLVLSRVDKYLFVKSNSIMLIIYIDNIIITGLYKEEIYKLVKVIGIMFSITNIREPNYYLGIKIDKNPKTRGI
jgi:hypothetical protein